MNKHAFWYLLGGSYALGLTLIIFAAWIPGLIALLLCLVVLFYGIRKGY